MINDKTRGQTAEIVAALRRIDTPDMLAEAERRGVTINPKVALLAADLIEAQQTEIARVTKERDEAVGDMTALATIIRERSEDDTDCCFACEYQDSVECPGHETDDCFKWCGPENEA